MATQLGIINAALALIGAQPISSLSENDDGAVIATSIYESVKKAAISSFPWNFALRQVTLPILASPTHTTKYQYAYLVPSDSLRILGFTTRDEFIVRGNEIHTNAYNPDLVYIADVDEGEFPAYFTSAMEHQLASDLCIPLTENNTSAQIFEERARRKWQIARSLDSQARTNQSLDINISNITYAFPESRGR